MDQYKAPKGLSRPRSVTEVVAELDRELGVRGRCYEKWLREGKVSIQDASDRYERLATGLELMKEMARNLGAMADEPVKPVSVVVQMPTNEEMGFQQPARVGA